MFQFGFQASNSKSPLNVNARAARGFDELESRSVALGFHRERFQSAADLFFFQKPALGPDQVGRSQSKSIPIATEKLTKDSAAKPYVEGRVAADLPNPSGKEIPD